MIDPNFFQNFPEKCEKSSKIQALCCFEIYMAARDIMGNWVRKDDCACAAVQHFCGILVNVAKAFSNPTRQTREGLGTRLGLLI